MKNVPDELLVDILDAWESCEGPSKSFYKAIGSTSAQMASLMGRAKRLKREGIVGSGEFKEVNVTPQTTNTGGNPPIILRFKKDNIIFLVYWITKFRLANKP